MNPTPPASFAAGVVSTSSEPNGSVGSTRRIPHAQYASSGSPVSAVVVASVEPADVSPAAATPVAPPTKWSTSPRVMPYSARASNKPEFSTASFPGTPGKRSKSTRLCPVAVSWNEGNASTPLPPHSRSHVSPANPGWHTHAPPTPHDPCTHGAQGVAQSSPKYPQPPESLVSSRQTHTPSTRAAATACAFSAGDSVMSA